MPIVGKRAGSLLAVDSILISLDSEFTVTLLPANQRSATGCRLDISLLSATHQGAECRSASKVTRQNSVRWARKIDFCLIIWNFRFFIHICCINTISLFVYSEIIRIFAVENIINELS